MSERATPHGGRDLKPLLSDRKEKAEPLADAFTSKKVPMSIREKLDVLMFSIGAHTPLVGFMNESECGKVYDEMTDTNNLFWPIPITLSADTELASSMQR